MIPTTPAAASPGERAAAALDVVPRGVESLLGPGLIERLGWTLVHSLWQGVLVAALLAAALLALRRRPAAARHAACLAALLLLAAGPALTFLLVRAATPSSAPVAAPAPPAVFVDAPAAPPVPTPHIVAAPPAARTIESPVFLPAPAAPPPAPSPSLPHALLVTAWLLGVAALFAWHLGGWVQVERLRRAGTRAVGPPWDDRFAALCRRLRVTRPVRLLESALVEVPTVAGWLRPVVLVPAAALSGLPPHQLEAILAHELAHVRRNDYLVNLLQALIETLLFYHPAVWWVSTQLRREREDCCDDDAARACGGAVAFARALAALEELRPRPAAPKMALAATGTPLLRRVRRLLGLAPTSAPRTSRRTWSLAAAVLAASLALLPAAVSRLSGNAGGDDAQQPAAADKSPARNFPGPAGTVRDESGAPVAGATVVLHYNRDHSGFGNRTVETVTTDAAGRYRFSAPLEYREVSNTDYTDHYLVFAAKEGHAAGWAVLYSGDAGRPAYDVTLTRPSPRTFLVTDDAGRPLAGARVEWGQGGTSADPVPHFRRHFFIEGGPDLLAATTGPDGRATLPHVPATLVSFRVTNGGYGRVWVRARGAEPAGELAARLTPAGTVAGAVRNEAGEPVAGAVVTLSALWMSDNRRALTDEAGRFHFEDVVAKGGSSVVPDGGSGMYRLRFKHDDYATAAPVDVAVEPGASVKDVELRAVRGTLVTGRAVEFGTGRPVPGAMIDFYGDSNSNGRTWSDAQGRYRFRAAPDEKLRAGVALPPGGWALPGEGGGHQLHAVTLGGAEKVEADLATRGPLIRLAAVRGRLLLPGGAPAAGARLCPQPAVRLDGASGNVFRTTSANADGSFEFPGVPAGHPLRLYAETPDHRFVFAGSVHVPGEGGAPVDVGGLTLRAAATARVLAVDAEGKPLANAELKIHPSFGADYVSAHERRAKTDAAGRFTLDGVLPDLHYLVRDGRYNMGQGEWLDSFRPIVPLLPKGGGGEETTLVLDNRIVMRVLDKGNPVVPVQFVNNIHVWMDDGRRWSLGGIQPHVLKRLEGGWVLIDQKHISLARPGNVLEAEIEVAGRERKKIAASAVYEAGRRLEFLTDAAVEELRAAAPAQAVPQPAAADEPPPAKSFPAPAGTVRDAQGAPVAGAAVVLHYSGNFRGRDTRTVETVTTNAAGAYQFAARLEFRNMRGPGNSADHYILFAHKPGLAVGWTVVHSDDAGGTGAATGAAQFDLTLDDKPARQSFAVVDAAGAPLPSARVELGRAGFVGDANPAFRKRYDAERVPDVVAAITGNDGHAALDNVPNTEVGFRISKSGFGHVWTELGERVPPERKVVLTPAGSISGTVRTAEGKPLRGADVSAVNNLTHNSYNTRTDDEGRFTFTDVAPKGSPRSWPGGGGPDAYEIIFQHDDYVIESRPSVEVEPGARVSSVDLRAVTGTLVTGRLLQRGTDRPIPGAWMDLSHDTGKGPDDRHPAVHDYTDEQGRFRFRTAAPVEGYVGIVAPPPGWGIPNQPREPRYIVRLEGKPAATIDVYTPLVALPRARGRILLPDGSPAAGAMIFPSPTVRFFWRTSNDVGRPAAAAADGSFEIAAVPAGLPLNVYAETTDRRFALGTTVKVPNPDAPWPQPGTVDLGTLRLEPSHKADVLVTDAAGKPLPDTHLRVHPSFGGENFISFGYRRDARTDAGGRLRLDGIVPGLDYLLRDGRNESLGRAMDQTFHATLPLLTVAGAPATDRVVLDTRFAVRVVSPGQNPVPVKLLTDARVWVDPATPWQARQTPKVLGRLDGGWVLLDGLAFDGLAPGRMLELEIETDDGKKLTASGPYQSGRGTELLTREAVDELQGGGARPAPADRPAAPGAAADVPTAADFVVRGKVTDADGKPLEGVEVVAHSGNGTLKITGTTRSGPDGAYRLTFGPGMRMARGPGAPAGVGFQAATISPRKEGWYDTNLHRQGDLAMSDLSPEKWNGLDAGYKGVVRPGEPREVNFVMAPAAKVEGRLVGPDGNPLAGRTVSVTGKDLPPSSSALDSVKTDADGRFRFDNVPPGRWWRLVVREANRHDAEADEFKLDAPAVYQAVVEGAPDGKPMVRLEAAPPKKADAGPMTIRGAVTDARTGKPVEKFRVVRAPADEAPARPPSPWQSHTITTHGGGKYELQIDRGWPLTRLRIDADGYRPAVSRVIEKQGGVVTVDVALEPGKGPTGKVITPDGKPAAGAQVTIATITNEMTVSDGRITPGGHGHRLATVVTAADDGAFELPPEIDPGTILAAHAEGYAEVPSAAFAAGGNLTLQPWGAVKGRIDVAGGVGEKWTVYVGSTRPNGNAPYVSHRAEVRPQKDGTFHAATFAPGRASASIFVETGPNARSAVTGTHAEVEIAPGQTADLTLGGRGRPVTGRVVAAGKPAGLVDWSKVKLRLVLEAPPVGRPGSEPMWQAYQKFLAGDRAKVYARDSTPAADGTFRLDGVPQGRYQVIGPVRFGARVVVPPMPGGKSDEPLDLGDLPFHGEPPTKPGAGDVAAAVDDPSPDDLARDDPVLAAQIRERDRLKSELERRALTFLPQHRVMVLLRNDLDAAAQDVRRRAAELRRKEGAAGAARDLPSVLLVTQDNFFLESALRALDVASKVVRPAEYAPDLAAKFDVVIFDRVPPDTRLPPNG